MACIKSVFNKLELELEFDFKLHRSYSVSFNLAHLSEIFFAKISIAI